MKTFLKVVLSIAAVILLTYIGNASFVIWGAVAGLVCSVLIIISVNKADVLFAIGLFQYGKDRHEAAYKFMKSAYATTKLAPNKVLLYSYMMIRDGKLTDAEAVLNKVTFLNRRDLSKVDLMNARINRAIILWKQDKLPEAIELLEEAYGQNMMSTTLYGTLGYFYILNNQLAKALEFNKEAYEYNSENAVIADNLAYNYILYSDFEKAEEIYKKVLAAKPQFIEPYYNYALLLEKRMQSREAIEYYKKALKFPEKYLSIITHESIYEAIERLEAGKITLDTVLEDDISPSVEQSEEIQSDEQTEVVSETDKGIEE